MEKGKQPGRIDLNQGSFTANGKIYKVQSVLSITRFCEFQILEKEIAFSMTFKNVFDEINEACELFDEARSFGEIAEARTKLDNLRRGIAKLEEKQPTALKLCALFINTEDEDATIWNQDLMNAKIEDWKIEGIAIQDFFQFALNSVNGFIGIYKKMSEATSEKIK